jgi:hypothetical protein
MNRRSILSISAVTVLGLAFVPSKAVSQQKSLRDQLVGAWVLVSQEFTSADGTKREGVAGVIGGNSRGVMILDASGRYAFVVGRSDRPKFKTTGVPRLDATPEEYKAAVVTFGANYGTWSVNEADKTLTQRFEGALIPNAEGTVDTESVSLAGDDLKLSASVASGRRDEVYQRAK